MKKILSIIILSLAFVSASSQTRSGYWLQRTFHVQMDRDAQMEEVRIYGHDNGHWPEFDLFKFYYEIYGAETGELKYVSEGDFLNDFYDIRTVDTDMDGCYEIYVPYIVEDSFRVSHDGYDMTCERGTARISLTPVHDHKIAEGKVRALVIAGQDGSHDWRDAGRYMLDMLNDSGRFQADLLYTPDFGEDMSVFKPKFDKYEVVVIYYGGVEWSDKVKSDFEAYVSNGGGVVVLHSSIIPMENWAEYNKMTGLGAWNGRDEKWGPYLYLKDDGGYIRDYTPGYAGYHGLQHETVITTRAVNHPIMAGLPRNWRHFKDEIYTSLRGPAENIEVLATFNEQGRNQPAMWTVGYGKGRVFVDVLGHCGSDPNMIYSMTCEGFRTTFLRGCEWSATGVVTIPPTPSFPGSDRTSTCSK